jgi:hypothetical protein
MSMPASSTPSTRLGSRKHKTRIVISLLAGLAPTLTALCSQPASAVPVYQGPAEAWNGFFTSPSLSPGPTNFEITFSGSPNIPTQTVTSGIDPFCQGTTGCTINSMYFSSTNTTTVTYMGNALQPNTQYHFGTLVADLDAFPACAVNWSYPSSPPMAGPIVSVASEGKFEKYSKYKYSVVYLQASFQPKGGFSGSWYLMPYVPKGSDQPHLQFSNCGSRTLYVSNSGIVVGIALPIDPRCRRDPACPENEQLLSMLNFAEMPPPGYSGSPFKPMQHPPPKVLKPGPPASRPAPGP